MIRAALLLALWLPLAAHAETVPEPEDFRQDEYRAPVPATLEGVTVVDTVGAGDTFNAGVLAALDEAGALSKDGIAGLDAEGWRAALALGIAAASVTVSRAGANPPLRSEL